MYHPKGTSRDLVKFSPVLCDCSWYKDAPGQHKWLDWNRNCFTLNALNKGLLYSFTAERYSCIYLSVIGPRPFSSSAVCTYSTTRKFFLYRFNCSCGGPPFLLWADHYQCLVVAFSSSFCSSQFYIRGILGGWRNESLPCLMKVIICYFGSVSNKVSTLLWLVALI